MESQSYHQVLNLEFTDPRQSLSCFQRFSCHPRTVIRASWLSCPSGQEGIRVKLGFGSSPCQRSERKWLDSIISSCFHQSMCAWDLGDTPPLQTPLSSIESNFCFKVTKRLHVCSIRTLCVNVYVCLCVCVRARTQRGHRTTTEGQASHQGFCMS